VIDGFGPAWHLRKPKPPQAKPKPGLSGQAGPEQHYMDYHHYKIQVEWTGVQWSPVESTRLSGVQWSPLDSVEYYRLLMPNDLQCRRHVRHCRVSIGQCLMGSRNHVPPLALRRSCFPSTLVLRSGPPLGSGP
jgi:hypothetical protein